GRLLTEVVGAATQSLNGEVALAVPRDHQRRRPGSDLADLVEESEPVQTRHLDVADDCVVVDVLDPFERAEARVRSVDLDPVDAQPQRLGKGVEQRGVVVDEQDPCVHRSGSSSGASSANGSSIKNVAPSPGLLITEMSPPYSLRIE